LPKRALLPAEPPPNRPQISERAAVLPRTILADGQEENKGKRTSLKHPNSFPSSAKGRAPPQQKKQLEYTRDHFTFGWHSSRTFPTTWKRKKTRANREYRRKSEELLTQAKAGIAVDDVELLADDLTAARFQKSVIRKRLHKTGTVTVGEKVKGKLEKREQTAGRKVQRHQHYDHAATSAISTLVSLDAFLAPHSRSARLTTPSNFSILCFIPVYPGAHKSTSHALTGLRALLFRRSALRPRTRRLPRSHIGPAMTCISLCGQYPHWLNRFRCLTMVGKNQIRIPQLAQQFRMSLCKELESSGFVRLNAGDFQDNCGEAGDLWIVRPRHLFKAGHIPFGDVRLLKEPEDVVLVLNGLPLALRLGLAAFAHMDFVTFTGKLLVRTFVPANPAVMSHLRSFQRLEKLR